MKEGEFLVEERNCEIQRSAFFFVKQSKKSIKPFLLQQQLRAFVIGGLIRSMTNKSCLLLCWRLVFQVFMK